MFPMFHAFGANSPIEIDGGKCVIQVHFSERRKLKISFFVQFELDDKIRFEDSKESQRNNFRMFELKRYFDQDYGFGFALCDSWS